MKKLTLSALLFAATVLTSAVQAQIINGDLNHNDVLDVGDVTMVIDGYLTGETEVINATSNPFEVDNSQIVGTWYKLETERMESITFREDGTTDYLGGYNYQYLPMQGRVFFFNSKGEPISTTLHVQYVTSQYLAILPTGSDNAVFYTSTDNYNNGYKYVDLGLSVKWATTNVGANAPEEYGDYFAWGETEPKSTYSWETYKWGNGSNNTMTKYCTDSDYGTVDNRTTLELSDDAARANWGGTWRIPTRDEFTELRTKCTWEWTSLNGVYGRKVTGPNGNSIFLPAAGYRSGSSLSDAGGYGYYWSSSLYTGYPLLGWFLYFNSSNFLVNYGNRYYGRSVRAVCQ